MNNNQTNKTAILVHGMFLQANGWKKNVWGDVETGKLGRLPTAVLMFHNYNASTIIFGTGASMIDKEKESQFTYRTLMKLFDELGQFTQFQGIDLVALRERIIASHVIDTETQNTLQEVQAAARVCVDRGITDLIQVSSPSHLPRCIRDGIKALQAAEFAGKKLTLLATASEVCYNGATDDDTLIVEYPHRADSPAGYYGMHAALKALMPKFYPAKVAAETRNRIIAGISKLLES